MRRDVDIAVRMARPQQSALFAKRIGALNAVFFAHRSYLQKHGEPTTIEELRGHTLIGYDHVRPMAAALAKVPIEVTRDLFALRTDNEAAQIAAMRAGYGVLPCQRALAARDPNLVPILEGVFDFDLELWVVMHEDLTTDPRMRRLFDHLAAGLEEAYAASRSDGREG